MTVCKLVDIVCQYGLEQCNDPNIRSVNVFAVYYGVAKSEP